MKGLVFSEFLEFVEDRYSPEMVDDIIETTDLPSGGIYTSVGTYRHHELLYLVAALSEMSNVPAPDLVRAFGHHLFRRLVTSYPHFTSAADNAFDFIRSVEDHIHVEVRKLYPDAELPEFEFASPSPEQLIVTYRSQRALGDLALGMMEGACEHFGEEISIQRDTEFRSYGSAMRFVLTMKE